MYFLKSLVSVKDEDSLRVSYIKEDTFAAIVRAEIDESVLNSFLYEIYDQLSDNNISIERLDELIADKIRQLSLPPTLDLALACLSKEKLYIKTIGAGVVYGVADNKLVEIISADKTAVGKVDAVPWYVLSFSDESMSQLESVGFSDYQSFANQIHTNSLQLSGVFVNVASFESEIHKQNTAEHRFGFKNFAINQNYLKVGLLIIIVLALSFSVYFGYQKRLTQRYDSLLQTSREEVSALLAQAEKTVMVDPDSARQLISQAAQKIEGVRSQLPDKYEGQIKEIEDNILAKQSELFKESASSSEEFFDFSLFEDNYKADSVSLSGEFLTVISDNNQIYLLNLETKEKTQIKKNQSALTYLAVETQRDSFSRLFAYGQDGLFVYDQNNWEKIVDQDQNWSNIVDFSYYGRNLYLLDAGANQIFKHTPLAEGYSQALEYLSSENISFSDKAKFAIDGSIYVVDKDKIYKFLRGARQSFSADLPETNYSFDLIYTSVDTSNLYLLDKLNNKVYVIDKETGNLIEQLNTELANKAVGIFVYNQKIYLATADKIYLLN